MTLRMNRLTRVLACSYAEMDKVAKNKISHRFRALEKLREWIEGGGLKE